MHQKIIKFVFIVCLSLIFAVLSAFAQNKDKDQNKNTPPGWEKGEKKGWQSDVPPGQEKQDGNIDQRKNKQQNRQGKKSNAKFDQEGEESETESELEKEKQEIKNKNEMKVKEVELKKEEGATKLKSKKKKSKAQSEMEKSN